ncbi:hypothetical protein C1I99_00870 [Micromonospora deserti]|uniref:Uncharacterized protein n=1 Tax=Micromonospora deserti TaxID=2070366 RepID=A0A2W2DPM4_9ACTN|nr:hypothetical protein C1I99_00870 [Micromonospora deserti]
MSTTYLGSVALTELEQAQAELERHLAVRPNGQCATCGEVEPCSGSRSAGGTIIRLGRLPRRRPGASGVRHGGGDSAGPTPSSWFAANRNADGPAR